MEVKNKTMYHIHTPNEYDKLWREGNILYIDNNFLSESGLLMQYFNTNVRCSDGSLASLQGYLKDCLVQGIENVDPKMIEALFKDAYRIIYNTNRMKCEGALELIRQEKFKLYPSRLHSIWVTDKDNLDFWLDTLSGSEVFELCLTGNLFKTSDIYIPNNNLCMYQAMEIAEDYWNPTFTKEAEEKKEYLFQGKALIKRKCRK